MTFNRDDFPPINEEETQLILGHQFIYAIKAYRNRGGSFEQDRCAEDCPGEETCEYHHTYVTYNIGLFDAKRVIEFERDRLHKDRSLSPNARELLSNDVRNRVMDMVDSLATTRCVTRAHVLDYIVIEATKLSRPR